MLKTKITSPNWLDIIDVFLDPILVIVTFILGYVISNRIFKRTQKQELSETYDFFKLYLKRQNKSINKQIKSIKILIDDLNDSVPFKTVKAELIIQPTELLETIDKVKLVQSFKMKKKSKHDALEILSYISVSQENFKLFRESHHNFGTRQNNILLRWNKLLLEFHSSKIETTSIPREDLKKDEVLATINKFYNDLCEQPDDSPQIAREICLLPLKSYLEKVYQSDPSNKYALRFFPILEKLGICYYESEENIRQQVNYLSSLVDIIENHRTKPKVEKYC